MDAFQLLMQNAKCSKNKLVDNAISKGPKRAASGRSEPVLKRSRSSGSANGNLQSASHQLHLAAATAADPSPGKKQLPDHRPAESSPSTTARSSQEDVEAIEKFRKAFGRSSPLATTQNYHKLLVYDLEATCNKSRSIAPIEIIEISCVIVDTTIMKMQAEYQAFVRPTEHPLLDSFCVELTGIQQQQVDAAEPLEAVLQQHHVWLQTQGVLDEATTHAAVTWTEWDLKVGCAWTC